MWLGEPARTFTVTAVQSVWPEPRQAKSAVLHNFLVPDEPPEIPRLAFREVPEHAPQRAPLAGRQVPRRRAAERRVEDAAVDERELDLCGNQNFTARSC